jgi:methylglutaconyl-CoA hydratase
LEKGSIKTIVKNKIATITFSHPASNSFSTNMLKTLTEQLELISLNNDVLVVVLKSDGDGVFCAGASFDELLAIHNFEEGKSFFSGFAHVINAMRKCNKLIIGRAQGKAIGGGVGLLAACDYVFATQKSEVKLSELAIGIGPFVIEPAVSRRIGKTAMSQLTLKPTEWKTAQWAFDAKLFTETFASITELDIALDIFTSNLSNYNPEALAEIKKVLWENTSHWEELLYEKASISGKLVLSDFTKNALIEFKNNKK